MTDSLNSLTFRINCYNNKQKEKRELEGTGEKQNEVNKQKYENKSNVDSGQLGVGIVKAG